jgi:hypothetical protein
MHRRPSFLLESEPSSAAGLIPFLCP